MTAERRGERHACVHGHWLRRHDCPSDIKDPGKDHFDGARSNNHAAS